MGTQDEGQEGTLDGFVEYLRPLLENYGGFEVLVGFKGPIPEGMQSPALDTMRCRTDSLLPVERLSLSEDSSELCIRVPGLLAENPLVERGMTFSDFWHDLRVKVTASPGCGLVVSDERYFTKDDVRRIVEIQGDAWTGPSPEDVEEGDLLGRLDAGIAGVGIDVNEREGQLVLRVTLDQSTGR